MAFQGVEDVRGAMQELRLSGNESKSPVKKVRQLKARKWGLVDEDEML